MTPVAHRDLPTAVQPITNPNGNPEKEGEDQRERPQNKNRLSVTSAYITPSSATMDNERHLRSTLLVRRSPGMR